MRSLRAAAGLSQGGLAAALGVSRQTINAIETGRYEPSLRLAAQLSKAGALYARRSGSRDVTRLNALKWRDERDRTLAKSAFAVVGAAALLMVVAQFIVVAVTVTTAGSPFIWIACLQALILCFVWGVANSVAVRRG